MRMHSACVQLTYISVLKWAFSIHVQPNTYKTLKCIRTAERISPKHTSVLTWTAKLINPKIYLNLATNICHTAECTDFMIWGKIWLWFFLIQGALCAYITSEQTYPNCSLNIKWWTNNVWGQIKPIKTPWFPFRILSTLCVWSLVVLTLRRGTPGSLTE